MKHKLTSLCSIPVLAAMLLQSEFEIPIESKGYPVVQISMRLRI